MKTNGSFRGCALPLLSLVALVAGCSSSPAPDDGASDRGPERSPEYIIGHQCNPQACNAACQEQPGVSGGRCLGSLCECAAPTCGQLDQGPCAGNYCSQGHYDNLWHICDSCGELGTDCCDLGARGQTQSCYTAGTHCGSENRCENCGGAGQAPCSGDVCDNGLEGAWQTNGNSNPACVPLCGFPATPPCINGGCVWLGTSVASNGLCMPGSGGSGGGGGSGSSSGGGCTQVYCNEECSDPSTATGDPGYYCLGGPYPTTSDPGCEYVCQ